jgi:hypothetical protein
MRFFLVLIFPLLFMQRAAASPSPDTAAIAPESERRGIAEATTIRPFGGPRSDRTVLLQNQPNPASTYTDIYFFLLEGGPVSLRLYNSAGVEIGYFAVGENGIGLGGRWYLVHFRSSTISSGEYYYRLRAPGYVSVKKMTIVK